MTEIKKVYLTPEGAAKLQQELDQLWKVERPMVTEAVAEAAAMGDRSENAEYIYGKKRLREIDGRVRWIKKRLDRAVIVELRPEDQGTVFFGAWVRLEDAHGESSVYRLVGPDDFDPAKKMITLASPLGRALKGKKKGDRFTVKLPRGDQQYTVSEVSYDPMQ